MRIPPEYLPADARPARIAELERGIRREWLRYAITEAVVIVVPFGIVLAAYVSTESISSGVLVGVAVAAGISIAGLISYFLVARIRPLMSELETLRKLVDVPSGDS